MTVREFSFRRTERLSKNEVKGRIEKIVLLCQLEDRVDQPIEELSLGYRKRVNWQAIIHKPELVI